MINITLPDGAVRQYEAGVTALDVAKSISEGLARKVLTANVNGQVWDATRPINEDAKLTLLTWEDKDGQNTFWHSSAHLMAEAIESLFPGTKFWVGPAIEKGFYYDMDLGGRQITEEDLRTLEKKMNELAKQNNAYVRKPISKAEAVAYFEEKGDEYKLDLLKVCKMARSLFIHREILLICAAVRIFRIPVLSKLSSLPILPVLTGKGMKRINSLPVFTALHFPAKKNWMSTCKCWKKQRKETIANWAKNWVFIQWMMMLARADYVDAQWNYYH